MASVMLFKWRTMDTAPRDGKPFVHLDFVTYCGGAKRPIGISPWLSMLQDAGGYWREARHNHIVGIEGHGH